MDPNQALLDAQAHLDGGDLDGCRESLANYRRWRDGGGFQPADGDYRYHRLRRLLREAVPCPCT